MELLKRGFEISKTTFFHRLYALSYSLTNFSISCACSEVTCRFNQSKHARNVIGFEGQVGIICSDLLLCYADFYLLLLFASFRFSCLNCRSFVKECNQLLQVVTKNELSVSSLRFVQHLDS